MTQSKTYLRGLFIIFLLAGLVGLVVAPSINSVNAAPPAAVSASCPSGTTITKWTFDGNSLSPSTGNGTFTPGSGLTGPTFPAGPAGSPDVAVSFSNWPNTSSINAVDNIELDISTVGKNSISLGFDYRATPAGPGTLELYYSTDGTNFVSSGLTVPVQKDSAWHSSNFDLNSITLLNNNANAKFILYGYNTRSTSSSGTLSLDNISLYCTPLVTVNQAPTQADPASSVPVDFSVAFSQPINVGSFIASDITQNGTAPGVTWNITDSGDHTNFTLSAITLTGNGTIIPSIDAGMVQDIDGYNNTASTSTDNTVTYNDTTFPTVTINRASGQASSTSILPISFSVVFSEPINISTFVVADITQNGTATGVTWSITDSGDHKNFTLSATAVSSAGTIIPSLDAGKVTDLVGNNNIASTSTDSTVTFTLCTTFSYHSLLINEVGWMGTKASSSDEWVELYNPGACTMDLANWTLVGTNLYYTTGRFTITFPSNAGVIAPGGYYVIAVNSGVFQNLTPNLLTSSLSLLNNYQALQLFSPTTTYTPVDTANNIGNYYWPAGTGSPNYASMERHGHADDGPAAWVTYAGPTGPTSTNVKDRNGNYVRGTPGGPNWANTVTITPSPVPTATSKPKIPTPVPPTPFAHVVINEFLPRAGFDWNNDGVVNTNDEFIEIENLGPISVNLSGWKLSDDPNIGKKTFSLPAQTLQPGQRAVFYGSTTHILLVDSGDTIRLINSRGVIVDARGYGVVKYPDQSHCRIPDGDGYWQLACFPTPGNENVLTGVMPSPPPAVKVNQPAPCLLPDTTPLEFRLAVCNPFGADIWNRKYWDSSAGQSQFIIPDPFSKGQVTVE